MSDQKPTAQTITDEQITKLAEQHGFRWVPKTADAFSQFDLCSYTRAILAIGEQKE